MGKESTLKALRKQLRPIVKEMLPDVLKNELVLLVAKDVKSFTEQSLSAIAKKVDSSLEEMNTRSKEIQSFVIRNSTTTPVPEVSPVPSEPSST